MNDYSDLIYTILSIAIFSVLLLQANSLMLRNDIVTVNHEYEKTAIAVAQSVIEEAKTRTFDENTNPEDIPGDFKDPGLFGNNGLDRENFTAFDHYHGLNEIVTTQLGDYEVNVTVTYVNDQPPFDISAGKSTSKRMTVTASSVGNDDFATLFYIKSFFNTSP